MPENQGGQCERKPLIGIKDKLVIVAALAIIEAGANWGITTTYFGSDRYNFINSVRTYASDIAFTLVGFNLVNSTINLLVARGDIRNVNVERSFRDLFISFIPLIPITINGLPKIGPSLPEIKL